MTWLLANPKLVAIGLLLLAVAGLIGWQRWQIDRLQSDVERLTQENTRQAISISMQNAQVSAWKNEAAERARKAQEAQKEARAYREIAEATRRNLYALQLPKEECDAFRTLVDAARGMRDTTEK